MTRSLAVGCLLLVTLIMSLPASADDEWVFVSVPDFLNADVADLSAAPGWDGGQHAQQPGQLAAIDHWLDAMAAENPEFVLVAGDQVMGHWDFDVDGRELFGSVDTLEEKHAAVRAAGNVIYPQWLSRFEDRGLEVHAAVGDHEVGDNPWHGDRLALVDTHKQVWASHFTEGRYTESYGGTAYAFQHRNLLVVTVDVFTVRDGAMHIEVSGGQLEWLDRVLSEATAEHVIVQGHVPVLGPVNGQHSSGMMLEEGVDSDFWETLCRHDVDLYFAGEHHDVTVNDGCVTQVVHGGHINLGGTTNYLVVTVGEGLELVSKVADATVSGSRRVWQTELNRPFANVTLSDFKVLGEAHYDGSWNGSGNLTSQSTSTPMPWLLGFAGVVAGFLIVLRYRSRRQVPYVEPRGRELLRSGSAGRPDR